MKGAHLPSIAPFAFIMMMMIPISTTAASSRQSNTDKPQQNPVRNLKSAQNIRRYQHLAPLSIDQFYIQKLHFSFFLSELYHRTCRLHRRKKIRNGIDKGKGGKGKRRLCILHWYYGLVNCASWLWYSSRERVCV